MDWLSVDPLTVIREEAILCLECGQALRQITNTHLRCHGLTAAEYKAKWGYRADRFLACEELRDLYARRERQLIAEGKFAPHRLTPDESLRGVRSCRKKALEQKISFRKSYTDEKYSRRERSYKVHPREKRIPLEEVRMLRRSGWSLSRLADLFGVSPATIQRRLGHVFPSDVRPKYRGSALDDGKGHEEIPRNSGNGKDKTDIHALVVTDGSSGV